METSLVVYIVANFLSQVIFIFPLFLGMMMYANDLKHRKNKNYVKYKINCNIQLLPRKTKVLPMSQAFNWKENTKIGMHKQRRRETWVACNYMTRAKHESDTCI